MTENNRNQVSQLNTDLIKYFNGGKHLALKLKPCLLLTVMQMSSQ